MAFFRKWKANSKHEKLSEELALQNSKESDQDINTSTISNENDVVTFKLKYIGSTVVEKITGENVTVEAVKTIIKTAKAMKMKRLQTVNLNISIRGISITDLQGNDVLKVSIYRISNCSTDASHRQIFSFISTDADETPECHAFLCSKRKVAQTVTLAVANAFGAAYRLWRRSSCSDDDADVATTGGAALSLDNRPDDRQEERLIDFDSEPLAEDIFSVDEEWSPAMLAKKEWVSFDDDPFVYPCK
ncbi:unnamed protein product [Phyllotreta striolata]|uniref:PID domain-containing protein n=1 Tax=Phyllotreta striolata TaxID=444603 RepID=A0A9N9XMB9_PHYSR|nr:unnamed protein product [Phyllotreta striolata]